MSSFELSNYGQSYEDDPCMFCMTPQEEMPQMVQSALYSKYSSTQNYSYTQEIDDLIQQAFSANGAAFREFLVLDDQDQFLKRIYRAEEYPQKIQILSEYYKFHKDVPRFFGLPIEVTIGKHHDYKREFQYKKIKKFLKDQQNHQFDSPRSNSDTYRNHSSFIKKSKYSTFLEKGEQSLAFAQTIEKLNKIVKGKDYELNLQDNQSKGQWKFEKWLLKQQKVNKKIKTVTKSKKAQKEKQSKPKQNNKSKSKQIKDKKYVYNTNINVQIKNAIFCNNPLPSKTKIVLKDLQNLNKLSTIRPLLKHFDEFNGVLERNSKARQKSISKVYGIEHKIVPEKIRKHKTIQHNDKKQANQYANKKFDTINTLTRPSSSDRFGNNTKRKEELKRQRSTTNREENKFKLIPGKSKSVPIIRLADIKKITATQVGKKASQPTTIDMKLESGFSSSKMSFAKVKADKTQNKKFETVKYKEFDRIKSLA